MLLQGAADTHASCDSHLILNKVPNHNGITLFTQQLMQPYQAFRHLAAVTDAVITETGLVGMRQCLCPKTAKGFQPD